MDRTAMQSTAGPTVTVAVPVLNEQTHIQRCLDAIQAQDYSGIVEVLVVDGGSSDTTRAMVSRHSTVRLIDNPLRIQAAGLNLALAQAKGEVFVRVDARSFIASDYVARCVAALVETGAAMVGGAIVPEMGAGWKQNGIAAAMTSPLGAGPARFHRGGSSGRWTDTVYLGAFRTRVALQVGGFDQQLATNEDAEFALRMARYGGVRYEPDIRSRYSPRTTLTALARQFYGYGKGRAGTVRRHPGQFALRQVAPLALVAGIVSPWRRYVLPVYLGAILGDAAMGAHRDPSSAIAMAVAIPTMHFSWAAGFLGGISGQLATEGEKSAGR